MRKAGNTLSADHARALIKQAIGIISGDTQIVNEAAAEITAIKAAHTALHPEPEPRLRSKRPGRPRKTAPSRDP